MNDVECPYCGAELEICHDDGYGMDEDELHQQECSECEKTFTYTTAIILHHTAYKADCLNGGEHQYKRTLTYPPQYAKMRCKTCWDEQPLPPQPPSSMDEGDMARDLQQENCK